MCYHVHIVLQLIWVVSILDIITQETAMQIMQRGIIDTQMGQDDRIGLQKMSLKKNIGIG